MTVYMYVFIYVSVIVFEDTEEAESVAVAGACLKRQQLTLYEVRGRDYGGRSASALSTQIISVIE